MPINCFDVIYATLSERRLCVTYNNFVAFLYIQSSDHAMFEPAGRRTILAYPISKPRRGSLVGSNVSGNEIELTSGTIFREETAIFFYGHSSTTSTDSNRVVIS